MGEHDVDRAAVQDQSTLCLIPVPLKGRYLDVHWPSCDGSAAELGYTACLVNRARPAAEPRAVMVSLIHHHTRHTGQAEFVSRLALQDEAAEATLRGA